MSGRNTMPKDVFDVLKRLFNCNWEQLADRLGVSKQTLWRWRNGDLGVKGADRLHQLALVALVSVDADWLLRCSDLEQVKRAGEAGEGRLTGVVASDDRSG